MTDEKKGTAMHDADAQARSEAARMMGRVRSQKKAEAGRRNLSIKRGRFPLKPIATIVCVCGLPAGEVGLPPVKHKSTCLRGRAIKYRLAKGLPLT